MLGEGVCHVILSFFRSYCDLNIEVDQPYVVLYGANGAGKTNLLEALSLLNGSRGLRSAKIDVLCHNHINNPETKKPWAVTVCTIQNNQKYRLSTGLSPDLFAQGKEKRIAKWEGVSVRPLSDMGYYLGVIWLTPAEDGLFRGTPSVRRQFLDRLATTLDPGHAVRLQRYTHAMAERHRLLKLEQQNDVMPWLDGLEKIMSEESVALHAMRLALIDRLNLAVDEIDTVFPKPILDLSGELTILFRSYSALQVEDILCEKFKEHRKKDQLIGRAAYGAHKCDLEVIYASKGVAACHCSTGEQKALLLTMTLAFTKMFKSRFMGLPLLLLDEVVAHLDRKRRQSLFDALTYINVQTWMTGTEKGFFEDAPKASTFYHIQESRVI